MSKKYFKTLGGTLVLASFLGLASPAFAQSSTTTYNGTTITTYYSTSTAPGNSQQSTTSTSSASTTGTTATSTGSGQATSTLSIQNQIALLQTQAIVLFGRIIMNISAQASSTPALTGPVNQLKQAWVGLALSHLSIIRARLGL
jgi:hypothetical protein